MRIRVDVSIALPDGESREYEVEFDQAEIALGRLAANDIQIPAERVAAEHATIHVVGDRLELSVHGDASAAETFLAGEAVSVGSRVPLPEGEAIEIAEVTLRVRRSLREITREVREETARTALRMALDIHFGPYLEVENDEEQGTVLCLPEGETIRIGRARDCELRLSHGSVSRRHAIVRRVDDVTTIEDDQSHNRTVVNRMRIDGPMELRDGDILQFGSTRIRYHDPGDDRVGTTDPGIPTGEELRTTFRMPEETPAGGRGDRTERGALRAAAPRSRRPSRRARRGPGSATSSSS
jgi:pSer/pThr/pTyr-binding forkhead associated (FHA) protein